MDTIRTNVKPSRLSPRSGVAPAAAGPTWACLPGHAAGWAYTPAPTLARAFAREPELMRAYPLVLGSKTPPAARRIFAVPRWVLAHRPRYADLCYHTSAAAVCAGDYEAAAELLKHAPGRNPPCGDTLILAAQVACLRGQPASVRVYLRAALQAGADYPDVHALMGGVWREEGKWHRARAAYQ